MILKTYKRTYGNGEVRYDDFFVADEGKIFTNAESEDGQIVVPVADIDNWTEVELPEPEPIDEEATTEDYEAALAELGVK